MESKIKLVFPVIEVYNGKFVSVSAKRKAIENSNKTQIK